MRKSRIKPISHKRQLELPRYHELVAKLRQLCNNRSELSGEQANWQTGFNVEPHHVLGRSGKRFLDPWGIILVTRAEHDSISQYPNAPVLDKEDILIFVKE